MLKEGLELKMKRRIKNFCFRGLFFSGFGPLVYALVMFILFLFNVDTSLDGKTVFLNVISTYLLAFICAGISIVWQEEKIGLSLQIMIHGLSLYICYLIIYIVNNWIPRNPLILLIFTGCFFLIYSLICLIIFMLGKKRAKKLNSYLK